jgi:hypothetical protein
MQVIDEALVNRLDLETKAHSHEVSAQAWRCLAATLHERGQHSLASTCDRDARLDTKRANEIRTLIKERYK